LKDACTDVQGGGDTEECSYSNGVKHGKAQYTWKAGHREEFIYEKVFACNPYRGRNGVSKP
jgi:hypothetical protein